MYVLSAQKIAYEPLRSIGFAGLGNAFVPIGTAMANPVRILAMRNNTDANLILSLDGITAVDAISANSGFIYDYGSNKSEKGGVAELSAGSLWYAKLEPGQVATVGTVYLTVIYASAS